MAKMFHAQIGTIGRICEKRDTVGQTQQQDPSDSDDHLIANKQAKKYRQKSLIKVTLI